MAKSKAKKKPSKKLKASSKAKPVLKRQAMQQPKAKGESHHMAKAPAHSKPVHAQHVHKHQHHAHREHRAPRNRLIMPVPTKCAMQATTSPFKAEENCAKIPDGHGGESFATTDKLRKTENDSVWLQAIQKANQQWIRYSSSLVSKVEGPHVPTPDDTTGALSQYGDNTIMAGTTVPGGYDLGLDALILGNGPPPVEPDTIMDSPLVLENPGDLGNVTQDDCAHTGWNVLACNMPVYPYRSDRPIGPWKDVKRPELEHEYLPDPPLLSCQGNYEERQIWRDIEIMSVYYFALPCTRIDAVKGNLGGPLNSYAASLPKSAKGRVRFRREFGDELPTPDQYNDPTMTLQTGIIGYNNTLDAEEIQSWKATHDMQLNDAYPMQLTAPMQVYRVLDFTFTSEIGQAEAEVVPSLDELREALLRCNPELSEMDILDKIRILETPTGEEIRYRAQVITPLAGVTRWDDFSTHIGSVLQNQKDYPNFMPADKAQYQPTTPSSSVLKGATLDQDYTSLRSVSVLSDISSRSRNDARKDPVRKGYGVNPDNKKLKPQNNYDVQQTRVQMYLNDPYLSAQRVVTAEPIPCLNVESDFTYSAGHNGVLEMQSISRTKVANTTLSYKYFKGDNTSTDFRDVAFEPVISNSSVDVTTTVDVGFTGALAAARRTVGFGMKLFSTEAALTANGRICGGQLPLALVTKLLNFQPMNYRHPTSSASAYTDVTQLNWEPLENKMDEWADSIESRLSDYVAFRAVDGCTVRYNPLQTDEQSKYVYTRAMCTAALTPVNVALDSMPMLSGTQKLYGNAPNDFNMFSSKPHIIPDKGETAISSFRSSLPQAFLPPCDGSENVPVIMFSPADSNRMNYSDIDLRSQDGMFLQAVIHTEAMPTGVFPMGQVDSVFDPNWSIYSRICCEDDNFPIVVEGHSFGSFFRKAGKVARTALKFGARAVEVGEILLPLLGA